MAVSSFAVLGGGIAGLAAAHRLRRLGHRVLLVEASGAPGGKLRSAEVGGVSLDVGADVFLARVPEALALVDELGLRDELVTPATTQAHVWTRGALHPLPEGSLLGVPTSVRSLRGTSVLTRAEVRRVAKDRWRRHQPVTEDVAVGAAVTERLGRAVVERLVDPMLGGVYAGSADALSVQATAPQLAEALARGGPLLRALGAVRAQRPADDGPVFHSLRGGTAALADALAEHLDARDVLVRTRAAMVERVGRGWRVTLAGGRALLVDGVVVAAPAAEAARLLRVPAPAAADAVAEIEYADVAVVALAYRAGDLQLPAGSGFLVPNVEGRSVKAVTFTTQKWPHLAQRGVGLLRCSVGRAGQRPPADDALVVDLVRRDLEGMLGLAAVPVDALVTRWSPGLPQYAVGHQDRVARVEAALAGYPTLAVAGAAYEGVGIPACIRSGERAAARVAGVSAPPGE